MSIPRGCVRSYRQYPASNLTPLSPHLFQGGRNMAIPAAFFDFKSGNPTFGRFVGNCHFRVDFFEGF